MHDRPLLSPGSHHCFCVTCTVRGRLADADEPSPAPPRSRGSSRTSHDDRERFLRVRLAPARTRPIRGIRPPAGPLVRAGPTPGASTSPTSSSRSGLTTPCPMPRDAGLRLCARSWQLLRAGDLQFRLFVCVPHLRQLRFQLYATDAAATRTAGSSRLVARGCCADDRSKNLRPKRNIRTAMHHEIMM